MTVIRTAHEKRCFSDLGESEGLNITIMAHRLVSGWHFKIAIRFGDDGPRHRKWDIKWQIYIYIYNIYILIFPGWPLPVVNVRADKSEKSEKSKSAKSKDEERAQDEVRNGSMPVPSGELT